MKPNGQCKVLAASRRWRSVCSWIRIVCMIGCIGSLKVVGEVQLDPTFDPGGTDWFAEHVLPLPSGQILLCGLFWNFNGESAPFIVRLNENGNLDRTFQ